MAITPENRMEQILNGESVVPQSRDEYFVKKAIDNAGQGGGSSLPTPGTAGNVLTADDGEWVSAAPSDNQVVITATVVPGVGTFELTDPSMLAADAMAAIASGKNVILRGAIEQDGTPFIVLVGEARCAVNLEAVYVEFDGTFINGINPQSFWAKMYDIDDTTYIDVSFGLIAPSATDNGKVLGVDDGAYALVSPSDIANGTVVFAATENNDDVTLSNGKTVADIYTAADAGKIVYLNVDDMLLRITSWGNSGAQYAASFSGIIAGLDAQTSSYIISAIAVAFNGNNEVTIGKMISSSMTVD